MNLQAGTKHLLGNRCCRIGLLLWLPRCSSRVYPKAHGSSFLGFRYRILNMNPRKELLWGLWVGLTRLRVLSLGFRWVFSAPFYSWPYLKTYTLGCSGMRVCAWWLRAMPTESLINILSCGQEPKSTTSISRRRFRRMHECERRLRHCDLVLERVCERARAAVERERGSERERE